MKKLLFFIAFTVLVLPLNAQVQDSMSREAKIYTEEVQISYGTIAVLFQLICQTSLVNI